MLARVSWWRITADFVCPSCDYKWETSFRQKGTVFPIIPFCYYDPSDTYLVRSDKKTISFAPYRCPNDACKSAHELSLEVSAPLEPVIPGPMEIKGLLHLISGDCVRMHDDDKAQLKQEIESFLATAETRTDTN